MKQFLVTIEFRYTANVEETEFDSGYRSKIITIGVYDTYDIACKEGGKQLEIFETFFKLNSHYNRKERFSKGKNLIGNLGYLKTPFAFYAKITTLEFCDIRETIETVLSEIKGVTL